VWLSIVMPVYNEGPTIVRALERVLAVDYPCPIELVVVDDGSADGSWDAIASVYDARIVRIQHSVNQGKGAAVRTGVDAAAGSHLLILDADLEYSPADIPALLAPVLAGDTDHVFGARVFGINTRYQSLKFAVGGRLTTLAANVLFDSCMTDMHTCFKLVPTHQFRSFRLTECGFGLDTELTARLLRAGVRPYEVPVSYNGRSVADGKKITWRDGVECLRILAKVRFGRAQALPAPVPAMPVRLHAVDSGRPAVPAEIAV
jgi:glycosyltransferase involved in cell wall biosynthesis